MAKQQPKTTIKKVVTKTAPAQKAKPVPVTRVKQVSDSLANSGRSKAILANDFSKNKSKASQQLSQQFKKSSNADLSRAVRYDKNVTDAVNKVKKKQAN